MKYILITFILLTFKAEAQIVVKPTTTSTLTFQSKTTLKIDTVKCMMLVCDTSRQMRVSNGLRLDSTANINNIRSLCCLAADTSYFPPASNVWWMKGYIVKTGGIYASNDTYLYDNKQPITKALFVWISIEIEGYPKPL